MRNYRLATTRDAERLLAIARSAHLKIFSLPSIVFVGEEDGVVHAGLGLDFERNAVIAGPLVLSPEAKRKRYLALRLVEQMESWLRGSGIQSYVFSTACSNRRWNAFCEKLGLKPYAKKDGRNWYVRELNHG